MKRLLVAALGLTLSTAVAAQIPGNFSPGQVYGNSSAGARPPRAETMTAMIDRMCGGTAAQGAIAYRNATSWVCLAAGTSGFALKTFGAGANPDWATVGTIVGSTGAADNRVLRSDGTGGATLQTSVVTLDDSGNATGFESVRFADNKGIQDTNANEVLIFRSVGSAVNYVDLSNTTTTGSPTFTAAGDDTNVGIRIRGKGTGPVLLGQATTTGVQLEADQPILDSSANELVKFSKAASAVNEISISNAATGTSPSIAATGGDADIFLILQGKGTGVPDVTQSNIRVDGVSVFPLRMARTTATFSKTSDTTLANVTGLSVTVVAGGVYKFRAVLFATSVAVGGAKAAIAGTATATTVIYHGTGLDLSAGANADSRATALGTAVASNPNYANNPIIYIDGTIVVNAGGTLTVQFAQDTSNATPSTVEIGSYFEVQRMS